MRLTIRILGLNLLDIEITTDTDEEYKGRDLSGGYLGSDSIDPGPTDKFMGFTLGLGNDE